MGSFRSKEDDVSKISTSIFVTNFPDSFSAKNLFHSCKQYGHVVDSFIPTKRTKDGKRFGFVRFINVFNVERLVTEEDHSLSHPPGFTPEEGLNEGNTVNLDMKDYGENERDDNSFVNLEDGKDNSESVNKNSESKRSGHSKYSVLPRTGGSILNLIEEVVKGDCSNEVVHKRTKILNKIHQVNNIQASEIAQKAKIKWAIEGDENGSSSVKLESLNIWGRFDKPSVNRACIDTPFPVSLSIDQKEDMERRISKEEVKRAVWDCGVDKSPGPDGFSFSFYRHFWPVIENDVFEAVDYFFMYGEIPNGCNSNFIALIPKILDANMVKDFRPISLIGSLYKIIAKILTNRLVGVLGDLVNEVQSAFVADRQTLDSPFILDEECSLWTKVIKVIYEEDKNLNKDVSGRVRTCWTSIVHEVRVLQGRGINVADYIRLKLGNGENTRFWVDNWYEGGFIKELFPRMFTLKLNKNATVSLKLNASSLDNSFRRKARSGIEEMQLNSLAEISRMTTLVPCEDRYVWTLESDGVFSVASIRKEIDGNRFQDVSLPTRWVKSVPIKVNIIAWKVKSNALPTRFNISRRGMDIDSIVCPICNAGVESTNHIFFQCVVVRQIMRKISSWWNIDYSDVNSYEEWQVWLVSIRIQSKLKGVLEGVYYGLWWYMWNFRNKLLFDKKIPEKALIFDNLVSSSFYWCKFRCKASFKWDDWLKNPYIVLV
ncbi:RNA-directed DNA polymerase, eukaryota [Tanacetum coccineum]